jgi:ABC-type sugar transport system ATPase subunit
MIMDEPTNNLGVPERHKMLELIRGLLDQGIPVILLSHILPDVFARRLDGHIVMYRGRNVTEKATSETDTQKFVQYMVGALDDTKV